MHAKRKFITELENGGCLKTVNFNYFSIQKSEFAALLIKIKFKKKHY